MFDVRSSGYSLDHIAWPTTSNLSLEFNISKPNRCRNQVLRMLMNLWPVFLGNAEWNEDAEIPSELEGMISIQCSLMVLMCKFSLQLSVRGPYPNIARNETFTSIIIHNFGRTCTYHCTGNWNCNLLCSCRGSSNFIMPAFLLVFPLALDTDAWVTVIWSQESAAGLRFQQWKCYGQMMIHTPEPPSVIHTRH